MGRFTPDLPLAVLGPAVVDLPWRTAGACYAGQITVPATGRWFLYAQLRGPGRLVEAWLPLDPSRPGRLVERRRLYLPTGRADGAGLPTTELVSGTLLYAVGILVLALTLLQVRRLPATPPSAP